MFKDRQTAGQQLTFQLLMFDEDEHTVVAGLPRGGVLVAAEVARNLGLPLEMIIVKKIGAPLNPEFAIGAIAEGGAQFLDRGVIREHGIPVAYVEREIGKQRGELNERVWHYRRERPSPDFHGKTVIIIDDGVATGATMCAAILAARKMRARAVIAAAPVISVPALELLQERADAVVCFGVMRPCSFAVGEYYESFPHVEDDAVLRAARSSRIVRPGQRAHTGRHVAVR